jgi:hypothetical protein
MGNQCETPCDILKIQNNNDYIDNRRKKSDDKLYTN